MSSRNSSNSIKQAYSTLNDAQEQVEIQTTERSADDFLDNNVDLQEEDESSNSTIISDTFLLDDRGPETSVSLQHLLLLTCGIGGQFAGSLVCRSFQWIGKTPEIVADPRPCMPLSVPDIAKPLLVSLGLSKPLTALVWIAAPISGVLIQPLMGIISDRSRSRWGRRKPFIIGGAFGVIVSMLALGWTRNLIYASAKILGGDPESDTTRTLVILIAVFWIYSLNCCVQPLQGCLRALIVENCPAYQQSQASAWASRMTGIGNIVGYFSGFTALPALLTWTELTQFQCLCMIASLSLIITISVTCTSVTEKSPPTLIPKSEARGVIVMWRDLTSIYRRMPSKIRKVCHIQFCSWMGWFPFLFYATTYVSELYAGCIADPEDFSLSSRNVATAAIVGRASSVSFVIQKTPCQDGVRFGAYASFIFAIVALLTNITLPVILSESGKDQASPEKFMRFSISQVWTYAHAVFAVAMFSTVFVTSQSGATFVVASVGVSWALTLWAPFAIIGGELAARQTLRNHVDDGNEEEMLLTFGEVQAGAIMGLHNVAISLPQIFAALACSAIFGLAKLAGSQDGTGWVLRAGGLAALAAAYLTSRFDK